MPSLSVAIIGAGPAGLTAGYLLAKQDVPVTVLEADPVYVGGISRTARYKGYHFDIGGHRFFSKSEAVEALWTELLPDDMLQRPRSSRIFYGGKFYSYPLKPVEALLNLGVFRSAACVLSYGKARLRPVKNPTNLEDWVSNQFGSMLFNIFFRTYTEKVWGMKCREISADWAAQRIKGLSLVSAVKNALLPQRRPKDQKHVIKTLIETFRYPRKGPGMMWEAATAKIRDLGGTVEMGQRVESCAYDEATESWTITSVGTDGQPLVTTAGHVISSAPIRSLIRMLRPEVSVEAKRAAEALRYRDFLTVVLMVRAEDAFTDNWIYIHDPNVRVGRIQNFKSWSPEMVPDPDMACYGMEYFCFEGDSLWTMADADLIELAKTELAQIGLGKPESVIDGTVVRQPKAYPVYDDAYVGHVETVRRELEVRFPTLHLVGRNGMHKYNNQDHSMMTAMLTAENIVAGEQRYDTWRVNGDAEYHEAGDAGAESSTSGLRQVPQRVEATS